MTNMKTLVALLMAGAAVTSCSSDNEMDSLKAPAGKTYTMTVQATKGGDATTRALELGAEGKTLTATWATTENVYVKKDDTCANGSLTPQTAAASTTLKGTLSGVTFAADDVLTLQFPKSGDITYAEQKGTLADIAANFDWATATIEVASVEGGNITPKAGASFAHQQAVVKFTLQDKGNSNAAISPSALTINDGTSDIVTLTGIPDATYTTNGAGVLFVAIPGFTEKTITLTATVGTDTYTCTASSKSFTNGKYYRVTAQMTKQASAPDGAISGQFSVSATKKVYFSKGNLQYQASTPTWRFAENQYDYVGDGGTNGGNVTGSNNASISETYTGWIDLFGWGTGDNPTKTSTNNNDYGSFTDWGTAAASSIGSGWRTLSSTEWEYLFGTNSSNKRTTTSDLYFAKATVNGVSGVILLPDDWSASNYDLISANSRDAAFTVNQISSSDWSSNFEAHGCVFLPAAGDRGWYTGPTVIGVGSIGYYWSGTANGTGSAYLVYFVSGSANGGVLPAASLNRYLGFSVRLVHDVE